mgnify:CR=1 FL=1
MATMRDADSCFYVKITGVLPAGLDVIFARAACMEKIYEIPRAGAARAPCAGSLLIKSTV